MAQLYLLKETNQDNNKKKRYLLKLLVFFLKPKRHIRGIKEPHAAPDP